MRSVSHPPLPSYARSLAAAALGFALVSGTDPSVLAQGSPEACGASQAALNDCAADEFARADAALNAAWGPAMEWARGMDESAGRDMAAGTWIGPPGFAGFGEVRSLAEGLLDAQRGWLRYRDGHCAALNAPHSGGSMWPMLYDGCRARLTSDRTDELLTLALPPDGRSDAAMPVASVAPVASDIDAQAAFCLFDAAAEAVPCTMTTEGTGDALRVMWEAGGEAITFSGQIGGGWWSGDLDGSPAMGHELNRGNVVFSTSDLDRTFQYWSPGMEHGSY